MVAIATLAVVVLSPPAGALADARAWKKRLLMLSGVGAAGLTAALGLLGPGDVAPAFAIYIAAAVLVGLGENFLGSFLPELATPRTMGRISAIGWTMSYVGALGLLAITAVAVFAFRLEQPSQMRWMFVLAGLWFGLGILPAMLMLRERATPLPEDQRRAAVVDAFSRLGQSIRAARKFVHLQRFWLAALVYGMGVYAVIFYAGIIGEILGFGLRELTLLALVMAVTAGAAAMITARYQDRIGHRRTILIFLGVWIVSTLALALTSLLKSDPRAFWLISAGIGLGLGGIGTAGRATVGAFTPPSKSGEVFGVWGMVLKLAAVLGVVAFGQMSSRVSQTAGLFLLVGFFVAGALLMLRVDEEEGVRAAHPPAG
jgi:UMF1 family MFS transporter